MKRNPRPGTPRPEKRTLPEDAAYADLGKKHGMLAAAGLREPARKREGARG